MAEPTDQSSGRVRMALHGESRQWVQIEAVDLPDERIADYRLATDGSRYVPKEKARLTPIHRALEIVVQLRRAGFHVEKPDPELAHVFKKISTELWLDREALKDRILRSDQENFERTGERMRPYQQDGSFWIAPKTSALLADEQGTGKTIQILVALPPNAPVLVVCPTNAKGVWQAERRKWRPQLRIYVVGDKKPYRHPQPGEMVVVNYERLPSVHDEEGVKGRKCDGTLPPEKCKGCKETVRFLGQPGMPGTQVFTKRDGHTLECNANLNLLEPRECPGCHPLLDSIPEGMVAIADEAQAIKNRKSIRSKRFCAFAERTRQRKGRTWLSSGTPVENKPVELWNIAKAAGAAENVFGSWPGFVTLFKGKKLRYGGFEWGEPGDEIKERLQRFMLRRLRKDVLPEIPAKTWGQIEVDLNPAKLREIEILLRQTGKSVEDIAKLVELEDIPLHEISKVRAALAAMKIPAMLDVVADFEEKEIPLIVFSAHRAPIDALAKLSGWVVLHGGMNADEKEVAKDAFQNGYVAAAGQSFVKDKEGVRRLTKNGEIVYPKGIGITIRAGGTAATLTRAWNVLFVDRDYTPTANAQAEDRAARFGQRFAVLIMTLVCNHALDMRVTEILIQKAKLISQSIDAAKDDVQAPVTVDVLDQELRELQEAVAFGGKVRRMPVSEEERGALTALHTLDYERQDERLALDLAEESTTIGLTDAQWKLAIKIAKRGKAPVRAEDAAAKSPAHIAHAGEAVGGVDEVVEEDSGDAPYDGPVSTAPSSKPETPRDPFSGWPTRSLPTSGRLR